MTLDAISAGDASSVASPARQGVLGLGVSCNIGTHCGRTIGFPTANLAQDGGTGVPQLEAHRLVTIPTD